MSSSPERTGTLPSRSAVSYQDEPTYSGDQPLDKSERSKLHRLSYKNEHIDLFTPAEARQRIASGKHRPGSAKAIEQNAAAIGMPIPAGALQFTDEEIEARNAARPADSGVKITRDEFTNKTLQAYRDEGGNVVMNEYSGKVIKGADPLNAILIEMQEKFAYIDYAQVDPATKKPGLKVYPRRFRWEHPNSPPRSGPKWDPVYDASGAQIVNGELRLVWMPEDAYDQGVRQPTLERSKNLTRAIKNRSEHMTDRDVPGGQVDDGQLQIDISEVDYATA